MDGANNIDLLFRGNIIEPPEDSVKVHVVNNNGVRSVPDCCGFRIIVRRQEDGDRGDTNKDASKQLETTECLTSWSVHRKTEFSNELVIKGKLIDQKSGTVLENKHNAGTFQKREKKDKIVTSKNTYRLIGPPSGSSNKITIAFYNFWTASGGGFPIKFHELFVEEK